MAYRRRRGRGAALVLAALAAGPAGRAAADEAADAPAPPSRTCAGAAAIYSGPKGLRLVATRRGSAAPENPLRPLSGNRLLVLQVVVNGRVATAFGPDAENMRQGPDPKRLEAQLGAPISWTADPEDYPDSIRIVAEDGRVLIDALRFQECGASAGAGPARAAPSGAGRGTASGADLPPLDMPAPRGSLE